jgi:hypothetical protein
MECETLAFKILDQRSGLPNKVTDRVVGSSGVIHMTYKRAADVKLGEGQPEEVG